MNVFISFFHKAIFPSQKFTIPHFYDLPPPFFAIPPHFEEFFVSVRLCPFFGKSYPLNEREE